MFRVIPGSKVKKYKGQEIIDEQSSIEQIIKSFGGKHSLFSAASYTEEIKDGVMWYLNSRYVYPEQLVKNICEYKLLFPDDGYSNEYQLTRTRQTKIKFNGEMVDHLEITDDYLLLVE